MHFATRKVGQPFRPIIAPIIIGPIIWCKIKITHAMQCKIVSKAQFFLPVMSGLYPPVILRMKSCILLKFIYQLLKLGLTGKPPISIVLFQNSCLYFTVFGGNCTRICKEYPAKIEIAVWEI